MDDNGKLDRLRLDEFTVTSPTGRRMTPHVGESVWVYPYGRTAEDVEHIRRVYSAMGRGDAEADEASFGVLCNFVADECARWDVTNPRTGEPYPQPDSATVIGQLPNELLMWLFQKLAGVETEGEGSAASEGSQNGSSETEAALSLVN